MRLDAGARVEARGRIRRDDGERFVLPMLVPITVRPITVICSFQERKRVDYEDGRHVGVDDL